jgi:hypothetical protein
VRAGAPARRIFIWHHRGSSHAVAKQAVDELGFVIEQDMPYSSQLVAAEDLVA